MVPRVFVVSDIHTDFEENMKWVRGLSDTKYANDAIILAGDVSDDLSVLGETLVLFASKFGIHFSHLGITSSGANDAAP